MTGPRGAFYAYSTSGYRTSSSSGSGIGLGIDASRSNPCYGKSDTVQVAALQLIAQIKY